MAAVNRIFALAVVVSFILALVVIVVALTVVLLPTSTRIDQTSQPVRGRRPCPPEIFQMTSQDLWPCQSLEIMKQLGIDPAILANQLPAVFPWEAEYNTLRLNVNLQQQKLPLFVVQARTEKDIQKTISVAQQYKQRISIRSGGHCNESFSIQNPIVLFLQKFNGISLNEATGILTCDGGVTQGQVFQTLAATKKRRYAFPLAHRYHAEATNEMAAVTTGTAADVGLSGIVSAGGVGFLQRQLGLTIDSVTSLRVALADGSVVQANSTNSHSDLFVAMRGSGGGNFGVITQMEFQLSEIADLIVFTITWSWQQAALVFDTWQHVAPRAPNALTQQMYFVIPDGGESATVTSTGVFIGGNQTVLESLLRPYLLIPSSSVNYSNSTFADQAKRFASGRKYYPFSYRRVPYAFEALNQKGIDVLIKRFESAIGIPGAHMIEFDPFGGKVATVQLSSSAFYPRSASIWLLFATSWQDSRDTADNLTWSRTIFNEMLPYTSPYCYAGFPMLDLPDYLHSYYGSLLPMLMETKRKYDPLDFFQFPQSIPLVAD